MTRISRPSLYFILYLIQLLNFFSKCGHGDLGELGNIVDKSIKIARMLLSLLPAKVEREIAIMKLNFGVLSWRCCKGNLALEVSARCMQMCMGMA